MTPGPYSKIDTQKDPSFTLLIAKQTVINMGAKISTPRHVFTKCYASSSPSTCKARAFFHLSRKHFQVVESANTPASPDLQDQSDYFAFVNGPGAMEDYNDERTSTVTSAENPTAVNPLSFRYTSDIGATSMLGCWPTQYGDIVYTAFLRMKNFTVDEFDILKRRSARALTALEKQLNCTILLHEKTLKMRAQLVVKFQIIGSDYRDVLRCRSSLPASIIDRLIMADSFEEHYM